MQFFARISPSKFIVAATSAILGSAALYGQQPSTPVTPSHPRSQQGRQISLHDQLRVGLKAVTKADFAFIDLIVAKVNARVLPRSLVDSTFLWARRRVATLDQRYLKRPMVYFQPAMVQRARAIGVTL
jgi:hypothetical protein